MMARICTRCLTILVHADTSRGIMPNDDHAARFTGPQPGVTAFRFDRAPRSLSPSKKT